jgi:hypothetical protein
MIDRQVEQLLEDLGQTTKGFKTLKDAMDATVRSATRQAMEQAKAHRELEASIKKELTDRGTNEALAKKQAKALIDRIKLEEEEYDAAKAAMEAGEKFKNKLNSTVDKIANFASSAVGASNSIYNTSKAFTAVTPTLDLLANTFKAVTSALGEALSGVGFEVAGFGINTGKASEALAHMINAVVDVTVQVAKMQLENSQRYLDSYTQMSKAGATFGGHLSGLANTAKDAGLNLQSYSNFIKNNAESLGAMGGTLDQAAGKITKMGSAAVKGDNALLMMYGGFEQVDDALAGYSRILSQQGTDISNMSMSSGAYLKNLKELSELTGQSAEALQKQQEEANRDIAWRQHINELNAKGAEGQAQALREQESYTLLLKTRGAEAAKVYQEYVATHGHLMSEAANTYAAQNRAQMASIMHYVEANHMEGEARKQYILKQNELDRQAIEAQNKGRGSLVAAYQYVAVEGLKELTTGVKEALETNNASKELGKAFEKVAQDTEKKADALTDKTAALLEAQLKASQRIDELTEKNMGKMAEIATQLTDMQVRLVNMFGDALPSALQKTIEGLNNLAEKAGAEGIHVNKDTGGSKSSGTTSTKTPYIKIPKNADIGLRQYDSEATSPAGRLWTKITNAISGNNEESAQPKGTTPAEVAGAANNNNLKDGVVPTIPGNLGTNGRQGTGLITKTLQDKLSAIAGAFPGSIITSLNDADIFPGHDAKNSKHGQGKAVDLVPQDKDWVKSKDLWLSKLKAIIPNAQVEEKGHMNANGNMATGAHLHAELANGGITRGPSLAGEAGPEAVIPLPDGRRIPVKLDTGDLIKKLDELLNVMKDHRDTSEKIHKAVA